MTASVSASAFRLPLVRLARTPRGWIPVVAWAVLAVVAAIVLRRSARTSADAIEVVFGQLVLPLASFTIVGAVLGGDGLARSTRALVAFGASPPRVALATVAAAVVASAFFEALVGAAVAALAHAGGDPPVVHDALTSGWIAALGGAAYAALFSFGASFGRRGIGRSLALFLDWVLGAGDGALAVVTPRGHVRSLLGGEGVLGLSGSASALVLVGLAVAFSALAVARTRRA